MFANMHAFTAYVRHFDTEPITFLPLFYPFYRTMLRAKSAVMPQSVRLSVRNV